MQLVPSMRAIHFTYVQSIRTFGNLLVWPWDDPIEGDWKYMNLCAGQSIGDLHHCKGTSQPASNARTEAQASNSVERTRLSGRLCVWGGVM